MLHYSCDKNVLYCSVPYWSGTSGTDGTVNQERDFLCKEKLAKKQRVNFWRDILCKEDLYVIWDIFPEYRRCGLFLYIDVSINHCALYEHFDRIVRHPLCCLFRSTLGVGHMEQIIQIKHPLSQLAGCGCYTCSP